MTGTRKSTRRGILLLALTALALMAGVVFIAWRLRPQPAFVAVPLELALDYPDAQFDSPDNAFHDFTTLLPVANRASVAWQQLVTQVPEDFIGRPSQEWTAEQTAHASRWLPMYQEGFAVLRRAAGRPLYIAPRPGSSIAFDHIRFISDLAQWLQFDTELALRDGDQLRAADDLLVCLRVAAQLPRYDDFFARREADELQDDTLETFTDLFARHRFTDPAAVHRLFAGLVAADADRWPLAQTLRAEYAAARAWLGLHQERQRLHTPPAAPLPFPPLTLTGIRGRGPRTVLAAPFNPPLPLRDLTRFFSRKVRTLESDPLRALRDEIAEDRTGIPEFGDFLTFKAPLRTIIRKEALAVARLRGVLLQTALLAFRLEHRGFPDALDALVPAYLPAIPLDPFDGQPFRFRRDPDGVTVWSIGPDLTDNHATQALTPAWRTMPDGDLVFPLSPPK